MHETRLLELSRLEEQMELRRLNARVAVLQTLVRDMFPLMGTSPLTDDIAGRVVAALENTDQSGEGGS